jgi:hypothetical protein
VTPDFWPDLRVFAELVAFPLLVLATIWAVALWREHHPNDEETDQ